MRLQDQVVLITGANRGIGRAIALAFAHEGARIAVTGRKLERCQLVVAEIASQGGTAQPFVLDVTEDDAVITTVDHIMSTWGRMDILVNSAGIIQYHTPVWETTIEDWDMMMRVNMRGTFVCCHAVIPHMRAQGHGAIINIASSSARMADDDLGPYTASKWGVAGYTTSLARSLRPHGIRVNGLNPGWVDTDMSRAFNLEGDPEWSTPEEIAQAALYLATRAPRDMTGQFIDIFGS